jgi:Protein of unknown function (DUF3631)/CHC2 zinc finger
MIMNFQTWVQQARATPLEKELQRRGVKLRRAGAEQVGACPKCGGDDRFAINTKKQVFNCRGCGAKGDVIELVQVLDGVDFNTACTVLAGPQPKKANGHDKDKAKDGSKKVIVGTFEYLDAAGAVVFVKDRIQFQKADGSFVLKDGKPDKVFRQRRPDPDHPGKWIHNVDGVPVIPYRLPEVIEAISADHTILVVEGEAKADLLAGWNVAATCCAGGAKKWKPEHSEFLRGADVVMLPDHDGAGWEHVNAVGASLSGIAKRVRVLVLPDLRPKGDIVDWAKAGGTREKLDALLAEAAKNWKAPTPEEINKAKDEGKQHEDELIEALSKLQPGIDFHRKRDEIAKELDVSKQALDAEIRLHREKVPLEGHWIVEPSIESVDGDSLLRDLVRCVRRYIVCSFDDAVVIALWVMFSWVHDDAAVFSPILMVTSAEPESGKTTTLNLISYLAPRAIASVEISKAALYRAIQLCKPSFIIDEFDDVLASAGKDEGKAELRSVINSGHTRGQCVIRCITDEHRPEKFSTFAPKAIGMVGRKLPPATLGRCIVVELRRRTENEIVEKFAHKDTAELGGLRSRLRRWSMDNADSLSGDVNMPPGFSNRRADNWRVIFAIADLCSGAGSGAEDWGDKARIAAGAIEGASDTSSIGVRLLTDIKRIFDEDGVDEIASATLVVRLKEDAEGPWLSWGRGKGGLTQNTLAILLGGGGGRGRASRGGFGIRSMDVDLPGGGRGKGFKRVQFEEPWKRYLVPRETDTPSEEVE